MQSKNQSSLIGNWIKDENELAIAKSFTEKRIGDYDAEDMVRLVELMAKWRLLLGVTSNVEADELTFICQFLYDGFKSFTLTDISLAMKYAIMGRTDLGFVSQKTLSAYYVSKAIQAYAEVKKSIVEKLAWEKEKYEERERNSQKLELTPMERANNFKDFLIAVYNDFCKNGFVTDFGDMVYNWAKNHQILKITPELISKALAYANEKYIQERSNETFNNLLVSAAEDPKTTENRKKKLAREYVVRQLFVSHQIYDLISKIKTEQFNQ